MKKIVFLIIIAIEIFAFQIKVDKNVLIPETLKKTFNEYWYYRIYNKYNLERKFEIPYLNYLYDINFYKNRVKVIYKIKKIIILDSKCNKNICLLRLQFITNNNKSIFLLDKWIRIENKWYHHYHDQNIISPFLNKGF